MWELFLFYTNIEDDTYEGHTIEVNASDDNNVEKHRWLDENNSR